MSERIRIGELAGAPAAASTRSATTSARACSRGPSAARATSASTTRLPSSACSFIRHCRSLDMNLAEIRLLLTPRDHPDDNCEDVIALLDTHMEQVARRIADLERLERYLRELRSCCQEGNVARECGILQGLAHGAEEPPAASQARNELSEESDSGR